MKELGAVTHALAVEEKRLDQLPLAITKMKEELKGPVNEAIHLHKQVKTIEGTADEDQRQIDAIDQIRLRAIQAIQDHLGSS